MFGMDNGPCTVGENVPQSKHSNVLEENHLASNLTTKKRLEEPRIARSPQVEQVSVSLKGIA